MPVRRAISFVPDLIDDQDIRLDMGTNGEGKSRSHARRIVLELLIHECADSGKLGNGIEFLDDFRALQPHHRACDQDILPASGILIESRAQR